MSPLAAAELDEFRRKISAATDTALNLIAGCMLDELIELIRKSSGADVSEISTMADALARELRLRGLAGVDPMIVRVLGGNA